MAGYIGNKAVGLNVTTGDILGDVGVGGNIDVDGISNLDVVDIDGAVNMATTALVTGVLTTTAATVFNGGFASNAVSTITTADNAAQLSLISTDTDASSGPRFDMYRNPGEAGADSDNIGQVNFFGLNDASEKTQFVYLATEINDAANGSEDSRFTIGALVAGADSSIIEYTQGTPATGADPEIVFNNTSRDINFRVESNGLENALFVDGGNNSVQVGSATPNLKFWHGSTLGPKFLVEQVGIPDAGNYVTMAAVRHDASAEGPQLGFAKSRATAAGGVTVAVAGDNLGTITWQGADGTNYIEGARISANVESGVAGNDMPADLRFFTNAGTTSTTERMRIAANGDLTATDTSISSNSDARLKENIADYTYDVAKFKQYEPKTFDWINSEAHNGRAGNRGFLAQAVKNIDDKWVGELPVSEDSPDYNIISDNVSLTSKLGEKDAMYISVIQQLIARIEVLEG